MRKYDRNELTRFLAAVDQCLSGPRRLILIGGAAASIAYGIIWVTTDIDTTESTEDLEEAVRLAREETGLDIPLEVAGVYDPPYCYEERLLPVELGLRNLQVFVPEKHDLVLMKTVRGQDNDLEAIQQIAERQGLDQRILIDRFRTEMKQTIGDPRRLRGNFLAVIERLYGESAADQVNSELDVPR